MNMTMEKDTQGAEGPNLIIEDACPIGKTETGRRRYEVYEKLSHIQLVLPSILDDTASENDIRLIQAWFADIPPELKDGGIIRQDFARSVIELAPSDQHRMWFCAACAKIPELRISQMNLILIAHWVRWIQANINQGICT